MNLRIITTLALSLLSTALFSSDLKILYSEFVPLSPTDSHIRVVLQWNNSWFNERNHDAVWLHFKSVSSRGGSNPIKVLSSGHEVINNPKNLSIVIKASDDNTGVLIEPSKQYRGSVFLTVLIRLDPEATRGFRYNEMAVFTFGNEMVFIPEGSFYVGDIAPPSLFNSSLYKVGANGEPVSAFQITSEQKVIEVGKQKDNLFYNVERDPQYRGDSKGTIPATFPKGHQAFYIMKYELKQGEYAAFLNVLDTAQVKARRNDRTKDYKKYRGTIDQLENKFVAAVPDRPCNFILWDDAMAFADWAGLRPMTELEYEKACRGTTPPVNGQYPWLTTSKNKLLRVITPDDNLTLLNNLTEAELNHTNLEVFGASYYWVMDLAGSLWERGVTIGDETGRAFTGNHGDGRLDSNGNANVEGWPKGIETSGYGYRGGGYYTHGRNYHDLNPNSPIGYRRYAAWSGGERTEAYGIRFVITAPKK